MTKTYTPLTIEGKIYVVVDAPEPPVSYYKGIHDEIIKACTKYETLPEHAPYWKERIGQRVEVTLDKIYKTTYAIPPQPKQDDGDLWDEADESIERDFGIPIKNLTGMAVLFYLKQHYTLKRK